MTWAEVGRLTDWATQAPLVVFFFRWQPQHQGAEAIWVGGLSLSFLVTCHKVVLFCCCCKQISLCITSVSKTWWSGRGVVFLDLLSLSLQCLQGRYALDEYVSFLFLLVGTSPILPWIRFLTDHGLELIWQFILLNCCLRGLLFEGICTFLRDSGRQTVFEKNLCSFGWNLRYAEKWERSMLQN